MDSRLRGAYTPTVHVFWAARNSTVGVDKICDYVRGIYKMMNDKACEVKVMDAELQSPKICDSFVVVNSQFPYRAFLSDWEKTGTPFYSISLDSPEATNIPFSQCQECIYWQ